MGYPTEQRKSWLWSSTWQINLQSVVAWHFNNVTTTFCIHKMGIQITVNIEYVVPALFGPWLQQGWKYKQNSASEKARKGHISSVVFSLCRLLTKVHTSGLFWSYYIP